MNYLVIYPGRFHPFHLGHKASYDYLVDKYGPESVYIATSDKQAPVTSPFSYSDKVEMMTKLGVPASHIVKVKNPYQATEITGNLSPEQREDTALIFAVSAKDAERFNFKPKRDGSPSYMQPLPEYPGQPKSQKRLKPMTKSAYIDITPTVNFKVRGRDANSATVVRQLFVDGNDTDRDQIITDLYGAPDSSLRDMFKKKLGITDHVVRMMQECRRLGTARSLALMERVIRAEREVLNEFAPSLNELALGAGLPAQLVASGKPDAWGQKEDQWIIQTRANEYLVKFSFDPEPQEDEYDDYDDYERAYNNSGMNTAFYARDKNGQWTMNITNVGEKELTQIIATVARLLAEFLKQHKHLTHIGIGGRDQRRNQIYQRLIKQNLQRYFPGQEFAIDQGGIRRVIKEFAPGPERDSGDDDDNASEYSAWHKKLFPMAQKYYQAMQNDDYDLMGKIESIVDTWKAKDSSGTLQSWTIGPEEGSYDEGDGVQCVLDGEYGNSSSISWPPGQLEGLSENLAVEHPDLDESADYIEEKWSAKYKRSINCAHPRGFSQRAHCAGRKK